jgi:hypothetical protein
MINQQLAFGTWLCPKRSNIQSLVILSATSPFVYEWAVESKDPYHLDMRRHGRVRDLRCYFDSMRKEA